MERDGACGERWWEREVKVLALKSGKIDIVDNSLSIEMTESSWPLLKFEIHSSHEECNDEDAIPILAKVHIIQAI